MALPIPREHAQNQDATIIWKTGTDAVPVKKLITRGLQRYWRVSRGLTLGAQACVIDSARRVLLIRHTYRPGWHFPGGGVEKLETIETALIRELHEEAGVIIEGRPALFAIYANHRMFPGDHIALYIVRSWHQPSVPPPNHEIAEQKFFDASALPADVNPATADRVGEIVGGRTPAAMW